MRTTSPHFPLGLPSSPTTLWIASRIKEAPNRSCETKTCSIGLESIQLLIRIQMAMAVARPLLPSSLRRKERREAQRDATRLKLATSLSSSTFHLAPISLTTSSHPTPFTTHIIICRRRRRLAICLLAALSSLASIRSALFAHAMTLSASTEYSSQC